MATLWQQTRSAEPPTHNLGRCPEGVAVRRKHMRSLHNQSAICETSRPSLAAKKRRPTLADSRDMNGVSASTQAAAISGSRECESPSSCRKPVIMARSDRYTRGGQIEHLREKRNVVIKRNMTRTQDVMRGDERDDGLTSA